MSIRSYLNMVFEPSLAFELIDDDALAPGFRVTARGDGYSGSTVIWLIRADADAFLNALEHLDASLNGEALLRAGWVEKGEAPADATADLVLAIRPFGHGGQLDVDVTMRACASQGGRNSARIWFVIPEPSALTRFRRALHALVGGNLGEPAVLTAALARADI
jgi:hypothetical protein